MCLMAYIAKLGRTNERRRRLAGRRPDFVRKTMQEARRASQLGPRPQPKMCPVGEL